MASESEIGQTMSSNTHGVADCIMNSWVLVELHGKADQRVWESRKRKDERSDSIQSTAGHVKSGGKPGGPPSKPKYYPMTDSEEYCEGKVKRTPGGEWKRTWNRKLTSRESTIRVWSRTFCRTGRRVTMWCELKCYRHGGEAKANLKRVESIMS